MDFGKILDQWDKHSGPINYDKDAEPAARAESSAFRRRRLLRKSPDDTLDLHGFSRDEAWDALSLFFNNAKNRGLEKVLVIHGKGSHTESQESGILRKMTRDFIEHCPFAGENGYSSAASGGTGSTWVLLKTGKKALNSMECRA